MPLKIARNSCAAKRHRLPPNTQTVCTNLQDSGFSMTQVSIGCTGGIDDIEAYGQWVFTAAQKAAEAAREGGFCGIGGTAVSDAEKAALATLKTVLGVKA
jgi:hypothetical protein